MDRRKFVFSTLGLSLAALMLDGCGSGKGTSPLPGGLGLSGSSGTSGGGGTTAGTRSTGRVILPPGSPVTLSSTALTSGYNAAALQNDGSFALDQFSGDAALLTLANAGGQPLLLGFSGSTSTGLVGEVSSLQTAVALLFYALGAFTLPDNAQEQVRVLLAQDAQVKVLGNQVASVLAANPLAIAQSDPALFASVAALRDAITTSTRKAASHLSRKSRQSAAASAPTLIAVNPANEVNGWSPTPNGSGAGLTITNSRRRNGLLYLYETSYTDVDGVAGKPIDHVSVAGDVLFATSGTAGFVGSLIDVATGTIAYLEVTSGPYNLDLFPADAAKSNYRIDLIGNGNGTDPQNVFGSNPAYPAAYLKISFITFAKDLLLPAIATLVGFQSSLTRDVTSGPITDAATNLIKSYDDLAGVLSGVVDLSIALDQNSARSAVIAVVKALANSGPFRQNFINWLIKYAADHGFAFSGQFGGALATSLNAIVSVVDKLLGAVDLGAVLVDWARSASFTRFDANVIAPKVKIMPNAAKLGADSTLTLTASVVADIPLVTYHWSILSGIGTLKNTTTGTMGASLDTSAPAVEYHSDATAAMGDTVTVAVEAFAGGINDPNRQSLGTASAILTISVPDPLILKGRFEVQTHQAPSKIPGAIDVSTNAFVITPRVKGAKKYAVRCYNFNDPFAYHTSYTNTWTEPLNLPDHAIVFDEDSVSDSELFDGISGGHGTGDADAVAISIVNETAGFNARFGSMIVEVTVSF